MRRSAPPRCPAHWRAGCAFQARADANPQSAEKWAGRSPRRAARETSPPPPRRDARAGRRAPPSVAGQRRVPRRACVRRRPLSKVWPRLSPSPSLSPPLGPFIPVQSQLACPTTSPLSAPKALVQSSVCVVAALPPSLSPPHPLPSSAPPAPPLPPARMTIVRRGYTLSGRVNFWVGFG